MGNGKLIEMLSKNYLRVYACRNTLQFFTIPTGLFLGGFMVDHVCEPVMSEYGDLSILKTLFGIGKGFGKSNFIYWGDILLTPESCFHGMRSQCAFLTHE